MTSTQDGTGPLRLLLAARLSSKQAKGQEGIGLETQDERSREWAQHQGHEVVAVAAGTAKGTIAPWDRKYLRKWLTEPELTGSYDGILCYATDRLSRGDQEDFTRIESWATERGKCIVIAGGGGGIMYPARNDSDYWQWAATKREANRELENIRERTARAIGKLHDDGKLCGKAPWGFAITGPKYNRALTPTAQGAQYVPEAFQRIADGQTLPVVAVWLTGKTGRTWYPRSVAQVIRHRAYRGEYPMSSGRFTHECPALVTGDLWRRANASLDARPSSRRGQRNDLAGAGAAVLSGMAYCGNPDCDASGRELGPSPMYKIVNGSGRQERTASYRCSGRGTPRKGCRTLVPLADADQLLDRAMGAMTGPVLRPVFHPATGHQVELDDIEAALRDLPARGLADDAEDAERARLRSGRKRLAGLPKTPAWTEYVETGESYGARWQRSDQGERRAWLREAGFALYLSRPDMDVDGPEDDQDHLSRTDVYESDRAVLTLRWEDDDDEGLGRGLPRLEAES